MAVKYRYEFTDLKEIFDGKRSFEEAEAIFEAEMDEFEEFEKFKKNQWKKDFKKIKLCYWFQALKQVFFSASQIKLPLDKHYSWCPYHDWFEEER